MSTPPTNPVMAANNPTAAVAAGSGGDNVEKTTPGIILRISATFFSRYTYFPLPHFSPTVAGDAELNSIFSDSLASAPHFPDITIFDSISSNILYQTYKSFPDFFHVYNLINRNHFPIPFPFPYAPVSAAIVIHEQSCFKLLVVCIEEHQNPLFFNVWNDKSSKPVVFFVYSSKSRKWFPVCNSFSVLSSDQLLPNRRNPVHTGEEVVYLDLTDRFLIRFAAMEEQIDSVPKVVSLWERSSIKPDEATRYGECRGWLHCAKINPVSARVEVYVWMMERERGLWRLVVTGKEGILRGVLLLGLHPKDENLVFVRSKVNDEILMVDVVRDRRWVVVGGKGAKCGKICFLRGMSEVFEAAMEDGEELKNSECGILHPHENAEGAEGEIFFVSVSESQLG